MKSIFERKDFFFNLKVNKQLFLCLTLWNFLGPFLNKGERENIHETEIINRFLLAFNVGIIKVRKRPKSLNHHHRYWWNGFEQFLLSRVITLEITTVSTFTSGIKITPEKNLKKFSFSNVSFLEDHYYHKNKFL